MHAALQSARPAAHELLQVPVEQTWFVPHALPQEPQWLGSTRVSVHSPLQSAKPEGHTH